MEWLKLVFERLNLVRKINPVYPLVLFFLFLFNRLDGLVCGALEYSDMIQGTGQAHIMAWWVLMSLTIVTVSLMLWASCPNKKQGAWYFGFMNLLYVGGYLDIMYVFNIPFPEMWASLDFIHYWHPAYIFFGFEWNIAWQALVWIITAVGLYALYRYLNKKYGIELMLVNK